MCPIIGPNLSKISLHFVADERSIIGVPRDGDFFRGNLRDMLKGRAQKSKEKALYNGRGIGNWRIGCYKKVHCENVRSREECSFLASKGRPPRHKILIKGAGGIKLTRG